MVYLVLILIILQYKKILKKLFFVMGTFSKLIWLPVDYKKQKEKNYLK